MKKEDLTKIKLLNASNIELTLRYSLAENNLKDAMFFCSGFGGSYGELGNVFSNYAKSRNQSFFWGQFQDTYDIKETKKYNPDGSYEKIKIGATYSTLSSTEEDFDCFLDYLYKQGFENIDLVATCVSCSKIIKYLKAGKDKNGLIKSLVLLAPSDLSLLKNRSKHIGLLEEAKINMCTGQPEKILSKYFLNYMPISSATYLDVCLNEEYNTLSYLSNVERLKDLKKINIPILFVLAQNDGSVLKNGTLNVQECLDLLCSNCNNAKSRMIPNSSHLFKDYENVVVESVKDFYYAQKMEVVTSGEGKDYD